MIGIAAEKCMPGSRRNGRRSRPQKPGSDSMTGYRHNGLDLAEDDDNDDDGEEDDDDNDNHDNDFYHRDHNKIMDHRDHNKIMALSCCHCVSIALLLF